MSEEKIHEIIIVGSGPAGLTAAIYTSRANLEPILLAGESWGGQLMNTTEVENFPGFPEGINGADLMMNMVKQAKRFGTQIKYEYASEVDLSGDIKIIKTSKVEYKAKAVIFATGSKPRQLSIPGEEKFWGRGVSTCATCDGAFYKDKVVAVIGGGDSAMEESTFLTRFAKKVYLIHRRDTFKASKIMAQRAIDNDKIEILWNTEAREVVGDDIVKEVKLFNNQTNEESTLPIDGFFLAIGSIPVTGYLGGGVNLDDEDYVQKIGDVGTNIDGVFVAGEIQDKVYKQAISTAGDGCKAALVAERWLESLED